MAALMPARGMVSAVISSRGVEDGRHASDQEVRSRRADGDGPSAVMSSRSLEIATGSDVIPREGVEPGPAHSKS